MAIYTALLAIGVVDQDSVVLAFVLAAVGLLLLLAGWFGVLPKISLSAGANKSTKATDLTVRCAAAAAVGIAMFAVSGWPVLTAFGATAGWYGPTLRNARKHRREAIDRVDAIATWVETIRDNISGAAGLTQALRNSGNNAPAPIRNEVRDLVLRLQLEPVVPSLRRFAADLAHPTSDMAVGCLILASSRSAGNLSSILAHTAQSARDSATMMRHVEAGRVHSQAQAKMVAIIALVMSLLMLITDSKFVDAYDGLTGQFVLFIICSLGAGCAVTMYRLGKAVPARRVFKGVEAGAVSTTVDPELVEV